MARPAPPTDDGSPLRWIATMLGIVGILLLGSLAWSAVGALISAVGEAASAISGSSPPPPTLGPAVAAPTPTVRVTIPTPPTVSASPTNGPTVVLAPTPTLAVVTPTPEVVARNPWILLPQPPPGGHVQPGAVTVEARARGDAPIASIHIDLDSAPLTVSVEKRSDSTWRGFANARVTPGDHTARATVTDAAGRSGSYRWSFSAGP